MAEPNWFARYVVRAAVTRPTMLAEGASSAPCSRVAVALGDLIRRTAGGAGSRGIDGGVAQSLARRALQEAKGKTKAGALRGPTRCMLGRKKGRSLSLRPLLVSIRLASTGCPRGSWLSAPSVRPGL